MDPKIDNIGPLTNAIEALRELREEAGGLYDQLIVAKVEISKLEKENILLKFQIDHERAYLRKAVRELREGRDPSGTAHPDSST